jgi:hypothetical protein
MLEKKEVLEVLGGFDVKDLNQVMELLQGKKYVESKGHNVEWSAIMDPLHKATTLVTFGKEYVEREQHLKETLNRIDDLIKNVDKVQPAELKSDELRMSLNLYFKSNKYESLLDDVNEVKKGVELSNGLLELKEVEFKDWKFLGYVEASVRVVGTFTKEMMKELSKKGVIL